MNKYTVSNDIVITIINFTACATRPRERPRTDRQSCGRFGGQRGGGPGKWFQ